MVPSCRPRVPGPGRRHARRRQRPARLAVLCLANVALPHAPSFDADRLATAWIDGGTCVRRQAAEGALSDVVARTGECARALRGVAAGPRARAVLFVVDDGFDSGHHHGEGRQRGERMVDPATRCCAARDGRCRDGEGGGARSPRQDPAAGHCRSGHRVNRVSAQDQQLSFGARSCSPEEGQEGECAHVGALASFGQCRCRCFARMSPLDEAVSDDWTRRCVATLYRPRGKGVVRGPGAPRSDEAVQATSVVRARASSVVAAAAKDCAAQSVSLCTVLQTRLSRTARPRSLIPGRAAVAQLLSRPPRARVDAPSPSASPSVRPRHAQIEYRT